MEQVKVIKSNTEPNNKNVLWLSREGLKEFKGNGWEVINGSNSESGSGGGFSQIYQCHTSEFIGTGGRLGKDYKGDDEQRRQNNIDVYNKLYNSMDRLRTESDNGTENYNLNDLLNFSQASYVHFIKEDSLSYNFNELFITKLFVTHEFFPEYNYKENGDVVGCFVFQTIDNNLPFVYLCADGTCYYISGF